MKKMIWLTTLSILFLIFVSPGILAFTLDMIPAADQPGYNSDKRLSIYGLRDAKQKFVSQEADLTAIGTSIKNPNLKNKKEIFLNLYGEDKNLVRTAVLNGQVVPDGAFVKFVFPPIRDSKGVTYTFTISTPTADDPEETIEVFYIESPTESILEFTYDEETYPGGFPIVTFHKPASKWEIVKSVYSDLLSRILF
jgi:hypothetical protein